MWIEFERSPDGSVMSVNMDRVEGFRPTKAGEGPDGTETVLVFGKGKTFVKTPYIEVMRLMAPVRPHLAWVNRETNKDVSA